MSDNPMFDEIGIDGKIGTYKFGDWRQYAVHNEKEVRGFFGDQYRFLSNFEPCDVYFNGELFPSAENAYQSAKVHPSQRSLFRNCTAYESKKLWKADGLQRLYTPADWDCIKYDIMMAIVFDKFYRNIDLRSRLLATGNKYLEETNHWNDVTWGVNHSTGLGKNWLGQILMITRKIWVLAPNEN